MKIFKNVRGTMENVPSIEVNVDTVYIRSNIIAIDEEDFKGWEYDEIQYDKDTYIELISKKNEELKIELVESNMEFLQLISAIVNQNEIEQAELLMEIMGMIAQIKGGE